MPKYETTVEADSVILGNTLNALPGSDIRVGLVGEMRRDEESRVGKVADIVCAIEDMVLQNTSDYARVHCDLLRNSGVIEKSLDGIVAWGEESDVPESV
jgi:hypothetical protein